MNNPRLDWFHQARFGMFVHWGLYSLLGRGEWVMYEEQIPAAEYAQLADQFTGDRFDADALAKLAKDAGAGYAILTTRHHDGYCLWDTQTTDFKSTARAANRDFVREWVEALRRHGIKVGLYYSLLDWRFEGYFNRNGASLRAMVDQAHAQVEELMTQYGEIDVLWYDGNWMAERGPDGRLVGHPRPEPGFWRAEELNAMVREHQPTILINNRSGVPEDLDTPEQHVTASQSGRGWEACMTIGDARGWGYLRNNPTRKPPVVLIEHLATAAAGEGNLLLNVGPDGSGIVPPEDAATIRTIGDWLAVNGEAIYGSKRCPFGTGLGGPLLGPTTTKGNAAYFIVVRWPGSTLDMPGIGNEVLGASVLGHPEVQPLVTRLPDGRIRISNLPETPPSDLPTVVKLTLDGPAKPRAFPDRL